MAALSGNNGNGNGHGEDQTTAEAETSPVFKQLFQAPRLEWAEEQRLIKSAKKGDLEARNRVIMANMLLVASIARKYCFRRAEYDDLVNEGIFGLIRAIEKYDSTKGKKFSTYAAWWVLRSVRKASRGNDRLIRLPDYLETMVRRVWSVESELRTKLGRSPETEEIAQEVQLTADKVKQLFSISLDPVSLDSPLSGEQAISLNDLIEDRFEDRAESQLERLEFIDRVRAAVAELDQRSAKVIRWRYGILTEKSHSLPEIAVRINRTRQRVNQIELEAMNRLRKIMLRKEFKDLYIE